MRTIPHNQPCLDRAESLAINEVLKSRWLVMGKEVERLESNMRQLTGRKYAVAVNSGLSALHLSLVALNIKQGDQVIIPSYVCAALLHAVNYVGAHPVLVDCEPDSFNLDIKQVKKKITARTKAIIAPHTYGYPLNMTELLRFKIPVIEDCAQALGSQVYGKAAGSRGKLSIFSFYASKMIAGGQGGMIVCNDRKIGEMVSDLIHHDQRPLYKVRYNYQMTDLTAAIVNAQLTKLKQFVERRRLIANQYRNVLDQRLQIEYFPKTNDSAANHYRFVLKFPDQNLRDKAKVGLASRGITAIVPLQKYQLLHNLLKLPKRVFPGAENLADTTLSLPVFPCLSKDQVERIVKALQKLI